MIDWPCCFRPVGEAAHHCGSVWQNETAYPIMSQRISRGPRYHICPQGHKSFYMPDS